MATEAATEGPHAPTTRDVSDVLRASEPPGLSSYNAGKAQEDARKLIAIILVTAYVTLLAVNVFGPTIIVKLLGMTPDEVSSMKSISDGLSGLLAGVVGVLGFVLGYYFKTEETKAK